MKVLQSFKEKDSWTLEFRCDSCQALLLVEEIDLVPHVTRTTIGKSILTFFKCEICKKSFRIDPPKIVENRIAAKLLKEF